MPTSAKTNTNLPNLATVSSELAKATKVPDLKSVRDKAEAVRVFAKNARLGLDVLNQAAELKIRAERKAGKMLAEMRLRGGNRRSKSHDATLNGFGITKHQSSRWQRMAAIADDDFETWVAETKAKDCELTAASLYRRSRHGKTAEEIDRPSEQPPPPDTEFRDNVRELMNHTESFDRIISAEVAPEGKFQDTEKRMLRRLVREFRHLLTVLEKTRH